MEVLSSARELFRGSEITIGTVVAGFLVWSLLNFKPAKKKETTKPAAASNPHTNKKADVKMETLEFRDNWTFQELAAYNGTNPSKPLLVSIKGQIYDVSSRMEMYGPGGSYSTFAGVDASYMLSIMNTEADKANKPYAHLGEAEQQSLSGWESFFNGKYTIVGKIPQSAFDA